MNWPSDWKQWSEFAQIVAIAGGLLFFAVKGIFGYFMINLSVEPTTHRQRGRDRRTDHVQLTLKLTKGDREGVTLDRIVISHKASTSLSRDTESHIIEEERFFNPHGGRFKLSPGEIAYFSYHFDVPSESAVRLEIEIFGASGFFARPRCYWKVAAVTLPRTSDA